MSERRPRHSQRHRLENLRARAGSLPTQEPPVQPNVSLDCGWGSLHFAQTFDSSRALADALTHEQADRRDIAFYVRDPHVVLAQAPQELFLDPSHTYRLNLLTYRPGRRRRHPGFQIRRLCTLADAEEVNRIYASWHMVQVDPQFFWTQRDSRKITVFVAEDVNDDSILGAITGVDHGRAFGDPECGASLWCLAVDPQATYPGVGETLVRQLAEHFQTRGCQYLDLSVLHDNQQAISLYEKLGFERIPVFAVKRRNPINEKLYSGPAPDGKLNPYARIIVDEARRRGIAVEVVDAEGGYFRLTYGGRSIVCRESLSELTSAVAMSRCHDKAITRRVLLQAGLPTPDQQEAGNVDENRRFLERHGSVVVKPAAGEQGHGISVDVRTPDELEAAVEEARRYGSTVLLEQFVAGQDLRVVVIDFRIVAAAIRRPPRICGDGRSPVRELIERQSRRRAAATGGESTIPLDAETQRCLRGEGLTLDDVPEKGREVEVRRTANLHTGGTIHDVTDQLSLGLVQAATRAARALDIPVVGLDFMIPDLTKDQYWIIEANERPGLANHEPQPTAERFVDLLFPQSMPTHVRAYREKRR